MIESLAPEVRRTARILIASTNDLKEEFVGREEMIDVLTLALLCREHALMIGPPGTAKTAVLDRFGAMLGGRSFRYLLTRFTEPSEIFGPVDMHAYQQEGIYRFNTDGMLPTAEVVVLDELFQGSSAILNALLTLANERVFHNGARRQESPLISLFGTTNELPDDPVLQAFGDRFLFRCRLDYVPDDLVENMLTAGWAAERRLDHPAQSPQFDLHEMRRLHHALLDVDLSPVRSEYVELVQAFRAEGVAFSDRRAVKAQKAVAGRALLSGRGVAEPADLEVLTWLWQDPHDRPAIVRALEGFGVRPSPRGPAARDVHEILFEVRELERRIAQLGGVEDGREALRRLGVLQNELRTAHPEAAEVRAEVHAAQREALNFLRISAGEPG